MPRGGFRAGAGRPKGSRKVAEPATVAPDIKRAARKAKLKPLDYMLAVMNDDEADAVRRDRMAIAAAPFCHPRAEAAAKGKKEQAAEAAKTAGSGSDWGDDLSPVPN